MQFFRIDRLFYTEKHRSYFKKQLRCNYALIIKIREP